MNDIAAPPGQSTRQERQWMAVGLRRLPCRYWWRGGALLLVTLTILAGCASLPPASGAAITDIEQIAGRWAGTINNGSEDFFYLTITPGSKLVAVWGINTARGTVTIRNGQAAFEMQPPISEGTIRLYLDGGRRTLIMDGVLPSFSARVTPQR